MARNYPTIDCPKCNAITIIPAKGPEDLSTNNYALNNIELNNLLMKQQ